MSITIVLEKIDELLNQLKPSIEQKMIESIQQKTQYLIDNWVEYNKHNITYNREKFFYRNHYRDYIIVKSRNNLGYCSSSDYDSGNVDISINMDKIKINAKRETEANIAAFKARETKKLDWILETPTSANLSLSNRFVGNIALEFGSKKMIYEITYEISSNRGTVYAKIVTRIYVPIAEKKNALKFRSINWVKENFF